MTIFPQFHKTSFFSHSCYYCLIFPFSLVSHSCGLLRVFSEFACSLDPWFDLYLLSRSNFFHFPIDWFENPFAFLDQSKHNQMRNSSLKFHLYANLRAWIRLKHNYSSSNHRLLLLGQCPAVLLIAPLSAFVQCSPLHRCADFSWTCLGKCMI